MPNLIDWMLHNWNKSVAKAGKSVWYTQHMLGKKLLNKVTTKVTKLQPRNALYFTLFWKETVLPRVCEGER